MGDVVWTHSQSLHLVSLINGLECLAQSGKKRLVPDASTKMFLDFMQEYAPGRPSRSRINKIYEVHSLVTHGERLLGYDTPQAHGLHPTSTADRESGTEAVLLARGAIINCSRSASSPIGGVVVLATQPIVVYTGHVRYAGIEPRTHRAVIPATAPCWYW
jgi:hypothetical protein